MSSLYNPNCVSVYVVCQTSEGSKYLLIRRCGKYLPGTWQMVTGKIEAGETAIQAALREVLEETGLTPAALYCADAVETFYIQGQDGINFVPVFLAFVDEMRVTLAPTEHDAFEWVFFEEARSRLCWPEQKRIIEQVHKYSVLEKPNEFRLVDLSKQASVFKKRVSRTGVYGIAVHDHKLLVVRQPKGPHEGKLDLPGGGIEMGETAEEALRREFQEEVGMTFETMQLVENLTAVTEGVEVGFPYYFHQVGLIYLINGLLKLGLKSELEPMWIEFDQLSNQALSPFLAQILAKKLVC